MNAIMKHDDAQIRIGELSLDPRVYRCHLAIVRDDQDSWSAIVLNLPGAGGCGSSESEAIESAKGSVIAMMESYEHEEIPWIDSTAGKADVPEGAKQMWVLVNV